MNEIPIDLVSAALVECQGKLKTASMDATNPFFKSKYATLGAIIEASREALYGAGLALQQNVDLTDGVVRVHTIIRHKSGQWLDGGELSLPIGENERNSDAQLAGSIMTYLKRYAWASVLGIYADEDSDGNEAPKGAVARQASKPYQNPSQPAKTAPSGVSDAPKASVATDKTRMWALNKLKGAPGQPLRDQMRHFLMSRGWIANDQDPEAWALAHVPTSEGEVVKLGAEFNEFCMRLAESK